jgi:ubiquitin C-terminal hydrolase
LVGLDEFPPIYDLVGVSNHCGTLNGGHYIAHIDTNAAAASAKGSKRSSSRRKSQRQRNQEAEADTSAHNDAGADGDRDDDTEPAAEPRWVCFNDEHVSLASTSSVVGPSAYVLFYRLREE